ncbi:MAG: hypothetical protein M1821_008216 [Bathelium mastoideum]|nr:MAG: hypothetical protein M1821_008216 [Bathelium mastoideum]
MTPETGAAILFTVAGVIGVGIVVVLCGFIFGWFRCRCMNRRKDGGGRAKQGSHLRQFQLRPEAKEGVDGFKQFQVDLERGFSVKSAVPASLSIPSTHSFKEPHISTRSLHSSSASGQYLLVHDAGETGSYTDSEEEGSKRSSHERQASCSDDQPEPRQSSCSEGNDANAKDGRPPVPPKEPSTVIPPTLPTLVIPELAPPVPASSPNHQPGLHTLLDREKNLARCATVDGTDESKASGSPSSLYSATTCGGVGDRRSRIDTFRESRFTHDRWSFASSLQIERGAGGNATVYEER